MDKINGITDSTHSTQKWFQIFLSCTLMFTTGATFAFGIFTVPVEKFGQFGNLLTGAWPFGMGLMHFLSAPVLIVTGLVLDYSRQKDLNFPIRILSVLASLSFLMFSLCSYGVVHGSRSIIMVGLSIQSIPLGIYYPLVTEHLFSWMPATPGLAVGLAQLSFGTGSILVAWLFNVLIERYGVVYSIIFSGIGMSFLSSVPSFFIAWPSNVSQLLDDDVIDGEDEALLSCAENKEHHLNWNELMFSFEFGLYIMAVLTAGVSYAFIPYYFKIGESFNVSSQVLIMTFQVTGVAATIFGLLASMWTDNFAIARNRWFSSGSKNMMGFFLVIQTSLCFALIFMSRMNLFIPFVISVAFMKMIMAAHAGCAALIARDFFGKKNSCIVFGIGGGLALGTGEGSSAALMAFVESHSPVDMVGPRMFEPFYFIAGIWSAVGLVCLILLKKHRKAFQNNRLSDIAKAV